MKDIRQCTEILTKWMKANGYTRDTKLRYTAAAHNIAAEICHDPNLSISLAAEKCLERSTKPSGRRISLYIRIADRLNEIMTAGEPSYRPVRCLHSAFFKAILSDMKSWDGWTSPGVGRNGYWRGYNFFQWLESRGHSDFSRLDLSTVREYAAAKMASGYCWRAFRDGMRLLFRYLNATDACRFDITPFLSFGAASRHPLLPAFGLHDASRLLASFDRSTAAGKRDYAFMLLAMTTGVRCGDLCRIVLTDFDWREGTLNLVQRKTGKPISIPLMPGASEAIRDYILNGRSNSRSKEVFLTVFPPYAPVTQHTMSTRFMQLCLAAGIARKPRDGKGLHSLRRLLGVALAKNDVTVPMIAQILGHSSVQSSERYLAIDGQSLCDCPLSFEGIKPEGLSWN